MTFLKIITGFMVGFMVCFLTLVVDREDLEFHTPYDTLYLTKEKSVWVVHSETESFYKVVRYKEGLKLASKLSGLDTDEYEAFVMNPEGFTTQEQEELNYYLNKTKEFTNE